MKNIAKLTIASFLLSFISCSKNFNISRLENGVLLNNSNSLSTDVFYAYDMIDSTKNYSEEYLEDMIRHNEKVEEKLDSLTSTLLNLKAEVIEESKNATKPEMPVYKKKIGLIDDELKKAKNIKTNLKKGSTMLKGRRNKKIEKKIEKN